MNPDPAYMLAAAAAAAGRCWYSSQQQQQQPAAASSQQQQPAASSSQQPAAEQQQPAWLLHGHAAASNLGQHSPLISKMRTFFKNRLRWYGFYRNSALYQRSRFLSCICKKKFFFP
jgi:hypothetical protein